MISAGDDQLDQDKAREAFEAAFELEEAGDRVAAITLLADPGRRLTKRRARELIFKLA